MKKSDVFFIVGWLLGMAGAAGAILFARQDLSVPTSQLVYSPVFLGISLLVVCVGFGLTMVVIARNLTGRGG